jgi:capsular exopolysaccharide synthesis family protein
MTTSESIQENEGQSIHLLDYVAIVRQRLPVAIGVFIAVTILTALYAWTRSPRYTATSRLLIENRGVNFTSMQDAFDPTRSTSAQRDLMQTQVQLLTTKPVMEDVLRLGFLDNSPDFQHARDPASYLARQIKATPAPSGFVLDVSVEREDPVEAAQIVNAVVDAFLMESRNRRLGVSDEGIAELRKKSDALRLRLDEETAALHAFLVSNSMVSFEDAQNIVVERLKGLNKTLMDAEPKRMQAEARYTAAKAAMTAGEAPESIPGVLGSSLIANLKLKIAEKEQEFTAYANMGENHPKVVQLQAQLSALKEQLQTEYENIVASLKGVYEEARQEVEMVSAELARQKEEVQHYNELAGQYNLLRQSRDSAQEAYSQIIRRIDELDISQLSGQGDNVFVVSKAEVPQTPSWPSRRKMLLIGLFLGAMLGIALCFFLDYMDTTIKNDTDVQTYLSASVLGAVPAIEREADEAPFDDLFALSSPRSHFAESFRTARTALAFTATDAPIQAFVVSSTLPSEGKSITSINLAIAYAQVGKKVLLVDADMRKPRLHDVFKAPARKIGLSNLLRADGEEDPATQIVTTAVEGLDLLPSGPLPPNPVELLDSARFAALLEKLRATYGIIIFDAPPSLDMVDALVLARHTDGIVLVTRAFSTNKYAARQVAQQVAASKARLLGVILNNVDMPTGAYSSYYSYYYSGRYYYGGSASSSSSSSSKSQKPRSFLARLFPSKHSHHKHHHHHSSSGSSSGTSA